MLTLSVGLICTGLLCAVLLMMNETGFNINVRKQPEYKVLWTGRVTRSGKVIVNGGKAIYLGNNTLTPGQRIVVASVC